MKIDRLISQLQHWPAPITILTLLVALISTIAILQLLRRRKEMRRWQMPGFSLIGAVWVTAVLIIISVLAPDFHKIKLLENTDFLITTLKVFASFYIILATIFFTRLIRWKFSTQKSLPKRKLFLLTNVMIWTISLSSILRLILKHPEKFFGFVLIKVAKVPITLMDLISVLFILTATEIILIFIKTFFDRSVQNGKLEQSTSVVLYRLTSYFLWTLAIVLAIEAMGFDITILLAGSAALLVGLGMGIQQLFLDFVSGLILLTERNVNVGDVIEVNGIVGKIVDLGFRTTIIQTRDNVRIIVPNSKLTSDSIINWTHSEKDTRFNVTVGVAYGSDVELVVRLLMQIASEHPKIKQKPKPFVRFEDFGDSALIFSLYFFTDHTFYAENIKSDLRLAIDRAFRENNIEIPFPQHDIHIKN